MVKQIGKVTYLIDMQDCRKRKRVFHVNMLREFFHDDNSAVVAGWAEHIDVDVCRMKYPCGGFWYLSRRSFQSTVDYRTGNAKCCAA